MDELKRLLLDTNETPDAKAAVRHLTPELYAAAERLRQKRRERIQTALFALCALAFLAVCGFVMTDYLTNGKLGQSSMISLGALGLGAVLTLILSPVLAYFTEEDLNHEED